LNILHCCIPCNFVGSIRKIVGSRNGNTTFDTNDKKASLAKQLRVALALKAPFENGVLRVGHGEFWEQTRLSPRGWLKATEKYSALDLERLFRRDSVRRPYCRIQSDRFAAQASSQVGDGSRGPKINEPLLAAPAGMFFSYSNWEAVLIKKHIQALSGAHHALNTINWHRQLKSDAKSMVQGRVNPCCMSEGEHRLPLMRLCWFVQAGFVSYVVNDCRPRLEAHDTQGVEWGVQCRCALC